MSVASLRFMRKLNARLERQRAALPQLVPKRELELQVLEAADFVTGGEAGFSRAANAKGAVIASWQIGDDEPYADFVVRSKSGAKALDAHRLVIGGLPNLAQFEDQRAIRPPPRWAIRLPDGGLHVGQIEALKVVQANRFTALRCGRRFGKTSLAAAIAADAALLGGNAGLYAPIFRLCTPLFDILASTLAPALKFSNRSSGELMLAGGGAAKVWSLDNAASGSGRGNRYTVVIIDEGAHGKPELMERWLAAMRPCLADTQGPAIVASTPCGVAEDNFFWRICNEPSYNFVEFVAATTRNPYILAAEVDNLRGQHNPAIFAQEFEAQFVNLAGVGLFNIEAMLNKGEPWETPAKFDTVFAALDSGVKGGAEHDASAVVYVGLNVFLAPHGLFVLDWQAVELGAGDLELWFAGVGRTLDEYAKRSRLGSKGVFVENAGLGEMLLAKADALGVRAEEVKSEWVSRGKDLRALSAEAAINGGRVKLTQPACDRISKLKGISRNHLLSQVASFRIADKEGWKRSDDLVDALVYAVLKAYTED
jgi:hypothetical protein